MTITYTWAAGRLSDHSAQSGGTIPHSKLRLWAAWFSVIWLTFTWDVDGLLRAQLRPVPAQVEAVDERQAL